MRRRFDLMLGLYALLHVYMWWRLVRPEPSPYWQIATVVVAVMGIGFPLIMRYVRFRQVPRQQAEAWLLLCHSRRFIAEPW